MTVAPAGPGLLSRRLPILALGMASLAAGLWAGLARLGFGAAADPAALHGPLMISGFFGTLIGLERAVALGRTWAYAAPLAVGFGAAGLLLGLPQAAGAGLILLGSLVSLAVSAVALRRQPELFTGVLALAVLCWAAGNALWLTGMPVSGLVTWWMLFLVLTIAAERLELTRFLPAVRGSRVLFAAIVASLFAGAVLGGMTSAAGTILFGGGALALAVWLVRFDIARQRLRQRGLPRYTAVCLLSGYAWLGAGGVLILLHGAAAYGAALHAILIGFVFAMVFGHAPIILPAVLRLPVPFRRRFYAPLVLLHAGLLLRTAGELAGWSAVWRWSGVGNVAAILLFVAVLAGTVGRPARGRWSARS